MAELVRKDPGAGNGPGSGADETSLKGVSIADAKPIDEENAVEVNIIGINFGMLDLLGPGRPHGRGADRPRTGPPEAGPWQRPQ